MAAKSRTDKEKQIRVSIVIAITGTFLGLFLLLFAIVNDSWIPIYMPSVPWSTKPPFALFEAQLFAIMGVCFSFGVASTAVLFYMLKTKRVNDPSFQQMRIKELEDELESIHRLLAITRDKE